MSNIKGVQFISYRQLAQDVRRWANVLPRDRFSAVAGIPRSGLAVAHLLASHLNIPAIQFHCNSFRQRTGRPLRRLSGPVLVVDDCCSLGTSINEARRRIDASLKAEFAAVYARPGGRKACGLDYWFKRHAEPDHEVLTEWNWCHHQGSYHLAVQDSVLMGPLRSRYVPSARLGAVIKTRYSTEAVKDWMTRCDVPECPVISWDESLAGEWPILVCDTAESAVAAHEQSGRHAISESDWTVHTKRPWVEKIFGIGLPRTGTTSWCAAIAQLGWKVMHNPLHIGELEYCEAAADIVVAANYKRLRVEHPTAKFVLTLRDEDQWLDSLRRIRNDRPVSFPHQTMPHIEHLAANLTTDSAARRCYREHAQAAAAELGDRLLRFHVAEGWGPLCQFLGEPVPDGPFPHLNQLSGQDVGYRN